MPLLLGLGLMALFVWLAENLGTFSRAWVHPRRARVWAQVGPAEIGAWYLLMLISYTLVAVVNGARQAPRAVAPHPAASRLARPGPAGMG